MLIGRPMLPHSMPFVSDIHQGWRTGLVMLGVDRHSFFSPTPEDRMVFLRLSSLTQALFYPRGKGLQTVAFRVLNGLSRRAYNGLRGLTKN